MWEVPATTFVIASIALFLASTQALFGLYRWLREPTFQVLAADFLTSSESSCRQIDLQSIVILARGGSRPRRVVNWALVGAAADQQDSGGINPLLANQVIDIPPNESIRFTLNEPGVRTMAGEYKRLRMTLVLDLGVYWEPVVFYIDQVADGNFSLDSSRHIRGLSHVLTWQNLPWWKRAVQRIWRRFL